MSVAIGSQFGNNLGRPVPDDSHFYRSHGIAGVVLSNLAIERGSQNPCQDDE